MFDAISLLYNCVLVCVRVCALIYTKLTFITCETAYIQIEKVGPSRLLNKLIGARVFSRHNISSTNITILTGLDVSAYMYSINDFARFPRGK